MMLHESWRRHLGVEFDKAYMLELQAFLKARQAEGGTIYPARSHWFAAFAATPFEKVRVVILGQDPYHGPNQAHGLSFSVPHGVAVPPSLRNIHKELASDLGIVTPGHGCLAAWADAGVLLLNATLTVEEKRAGAHQGKGWEQFTDAAISSLSANREHLVFMLWGSFAQSKAALIEGGKHLILTAPHPSPLSAHRGFLGCRHFSCANAYLEAHGMASVDWALEPSKEQLTLI
ncbi:Uracil-DNA glycosylase [Mariprofundus ferrinatatus]|uniref:Uracil-DNA glycosylase n=1 Tax=Mariprofundus ferrinatatus TaxID=1921087 RepID=A0A2K8L9U8_9PROT|nr:uracil-DNA glycosylase [Mariprofundus ferrinatatus]ATX81046.1 Uracil-DNA glycosylase [Mariprofundus ferrinatatus]